MDPENRNKARPNLPPDEIEALSKLIDLQKERKITIKPCDKGARIIIMNTDEYIASCEEHLASVQEQPDGTTKPFYRVADQEDITVAKEEIIKLLEEGRDNDYIDKKDFEAMDPTDKDTGRFYQLFKIHKEHENGQLPPGRPIVSGNNSITENIAKYVEHHIKNLAKKVPSFIEDTPDFLRHIEAINDKG